VQKLNFSKFPLANFLKLIFATPKKTGFSSFKNSPKFIQKTGYFFECFFWVFEFFEMMKALDQVFL
jgi:hypothetical protein